jgi:hypothetical protein
VVAAILALTVAVNGGLRDGADRLVRAAVAQLRSGALRSVGLTRPRAGEQALTEPLRQTIEMLRHNHVTTYRLSSGVGEHEFVRQRIIEGAWPIRFDATAEVEVAYLGERGDCAEFDRRVFDPNWPIPKRQAPLFAGKRGVRLARCP